MAVHMCQDLCVDVKNLKEQGQVYILFLKKEEPREKKEPLKKYKDNKKTRKLDFT